MLSIEVLLIFVPAVALFIILPGPNFAYISKVALVDGHRAGAKAALGIALGLCMHIILATFGLSAAIAKSLWLFYVIKYAGALFLFCLGIMAIIKSFKKHDTEEKFKGNVKNRHFITGGFLANFLNPNSFIYYVTFLPQFVDTDKNVYMQLLELGLISVIICLLWFILLSETLGRFRKIFTRSGFSSWSQRVTGLILVAFGIRIALKEINI